MHNKTSSDTIGTLGSPPRLGYLAEPRFLRRNLNFILNQHQFEVNRSLKRPDISTSNIRPRRSRPWKLPTDGMLRDLRSANSLIAIDGVSLRPLEGNISTGKSSTRRNGVRHGSAEKEPSPSAHDHSVDCTVTVDIRQRNDSKIPSKIDVKRGRILRVKSGSKLPEFEIELTQPICLDVGQIPTKTSTLNGTTKYHTQSSGDLTFRMTVRCDESDEATKFMNDLQSNSVAFYENLISSDDALTVKWPHLPRCPSPGQLLPIVVDNSAASSPMGYGAEISMKWNKSQKASTLERFNRLTVGSRSSTPSLDKRRDVSSDCAMPVSIRYLTRKNGRVHSVEENTLRCIFCNRNNEHTSFDRLHLHYLTHHEHFQLEIDENTRPEPGAPPRRIWLTPVQTPPKKTDPRREHAWQAPDRPFDVSKHVRGEGYWVTQKSRETTPATRADRPPTKLGRPPKVKVGDATPIIAPKTTFMERKPPWEVGELERAKKVRHQVPDVPGVVFYRTTSKQPIAPGSYISDSDDDVDEFWLAQKQRQELRDLGIQGVELKFNEALNEQLTLEKPSHDGMVGETLIRFAKKHAHMMENPSWKALFKARLDIFQQGGLIDEETVTFCLSWLPPKGDGNSSARVHRPKSPSAQIIEEMSRMTTNQEPPIARHESRRIVNGTNHSSQRPEERSASQKSTTHSLAGNAKSPDRLGPIKAIDKIPMRHPRAGFNERQLTCRRTATPNKDVFQVPAKAFLLRDTHEYDTTTSSAADLHPFDLDCGTFFAALKIHLNFDPDTDHLICTSTVIRRPLDNETDWHNALYIAHDNLDDGKAIQFEIAPRGTHKPSLPSVPIPTLILNDTNTMTRPKRALTVQSLLIEDPREKRIRIDLCPCGQPVSGTRGVIACVGKGCGKLSHRQCVRATAPDAVWWCGKCR